MKVIVATGEDYKGTQGEIITQVVVEGEVRFMGLYSKQLTNVLKIAETDLTEEEYKKEIGNDNLATMQLAFAKKQKEGYAFSIENVRC